MKIRRDAVELLQMHQVRYELEGQVETLSSSITGLQEQKEATMERMRVSQEEEVKLYHNMKAAIMKVCDQYIENVLELDGRYEVLWSNVDHSLDCCNKLLELTRPEVEALKVGTHLQTVKSSGDQLSAILSQANTRENNMKVTPIGDQPDVQVSDSLSAVHAMIQNEDVSSESQHSGTHGEPLLVYVDTGVRYAGRILCEPITAEGSVGGSHPADQQISKPVDAQPSLSFQDQIVSKPSKHFVQALSAVKPSLVLTHADKTETSGNSSPLFNDIFYPCNIVQQNDQAMPDKVPASQDCNSATISPSPTDISMPGKSLILSLSPAHTLSACHIESVTINEPTFPLLQKESSGYSDTVLVIEVVDEKEINVSEHQAEKSPNAMELMNNITPACSPVVGYLPHNAVITLAEGKASQA